MFGCRLRQCYILNWLRDRCRVRALARRFQRFSGTPRRVGTWVTIAVMIIYSYSNTHRHTHAYIHIYKHKNSTLTHTHKHKQTHKHLHLHTHTHTHTQTHTHIHGRTHLITYSLPPSLTHSLTRGLTCSSRSPERSRGSGLQRPVQGTWGRRTAPAGAPVIIRCNGNESVFSWERRWLKLVVVWVICCRLKFLQPPFEGLGGAALHQLAHLLILDTTAMRACSRV